MRTSREDVRLTLEELGGRASLDEIYEAFATRRERQRPKSWKAVIRKELEYNSSDSTNFQGKNDLFYSASGIGSGIWGVRDFLNQNPLPVDIEEILTERAECTVYRILRDTPLARRIKKLHKDSCQICGKRLSIGNGKGYSEAHHIKPLAAPHNGPDISENILVLCPNHHALCDFGAIELRSEDLKIVPGHVVDQKFVSYHNERIYRCVCRL